MHADIFQTETCKTIQKLATKARDVYTRQPCNGGSLAEIHVAVRHLLNSQDTRLLKLPERTVRGS
jgi:hypothetical protein